MNTPTLHTIEEALGDITRYLDEDTIKHLIADQKQADARGVMSQYQRFSKMAEQEPDAKKKIYYEFRALLPKELAVNLAKEYYQKETRHGVGSLESMMSGEDGGEMENSVLNVKASYGNPNITKGMFETMLNKGMDTPERRLEVSDLITKLYKNLSRAARIVLTARLLTGASTGKLRQKEGSPQFGMDVRELVRYLPKEYKDVEDQIKKLQDVTQVKPDNITSTMIFNGLVKDVNGTEQKVDRLIGKREITSANEELQKALHGIAGTENMPDLVKFLTGDNAINEAMDPNRVVAAIVAVLSGTKVKTSDLIKAVVFGVYQNLAAHTDLSKSKGWSGGIKDIARVYIDKAKSASTEKDWIALQDLFMAPVLAKTNPLQKLMK